MQILLTSYINWYSCQRVFVGVVYYLCVFQLSIWNIVHWGYLKPLFSMILS